MPDTQITWHGTTTHVYVESGTAAGKLADVQNAVDRLTIDPDALLSSDLLIKFKSPSDMPQVPGSDIAAWGYAKTGAARTMLVNNSLGSNRTQRVVQHELGHFFDADSMSAADKTDVMALMDPAGTTWRTSNYVNSPAEAFADTIPKAYSDFGAGSPYDYGRVVPEADWAAFRTIVGVAGTPPTLASTTLAAASAIGVTNIKVAAVTNLAVGDAVYIDTAASEEYRVLTFVGTAGSGGTGVSFTEPLTIAHSSGVAVVETEDGPPSGTVDIDRVVTRNTPHNGRLDYTIGDLPDGASGTWRVQFHDGTEWGPWCAAQDFLLFPTPGKPVNLTVTRGTLTPDFGASIDLSNHPGAIIEAWKIRVYQVTAQGNVAKMAVDEDGPIGGSANRVTIPYSGNEGGPLSDGQTYTWIVQLQNQYGNWSPWSDWQYFTVSLSAGATVSPNSTAAKIDDTTPTFTLAHSSLANVNQGQLRVWHATEDVILWDSGLDDFTSAASVQQTVASGILTFGMDFRVDARVRVTGESNAGAYTEKYLLRMNSQPGSPAPVTISHDTEQIVQTGTTSYVTTAANPKVKATFRDLDLDRGYVTEYPVSRRTSITNTSLTQLARLVRDTYALDDYVETAPAGSIYPFDQPAALSPTNSGWAAGTSAALSYDTDFKKDGPSSLKIAFTNLATATTSTQALANGLISAGAYTILSGLTTATIWARRSAGPTGLAVKLRFTFSGNSANYAEFTITPSANNTWEQFTLTFASPAATGGVVNWDQVSGLEVRASHSAGSNQTFNLWVDELDVVFASAEVTRRLRFAYEDSAAALSEYSEPIFVTYSLAPTLSSVTPADDATITDPTPTIEWTYASSGGKAQGSARVVVHDEDGFEVHDSGLLTDEEAEYTIPPFVLPDDSVLTWTLTVKDSDGLAVSVTRQFTTDFTAPVALTDLVVTPADSPPSLLVTWSDAAYDAAWYATYIYAKPAGGQFELVKTITDPATVEYRYLNASHNRETTIRMTQSNGFAESDGIEASGIVGDDGSGAADYVPGYWIKDGTLAFEVHLNGHGGDTPSNKEMVTAHGRTRKVIRDWGTTGYEGSFSVFADDRELIRLLRAYKDDDTVVIFSTPHGESRYVKFLRTPDTDRSGGYFDDSVSYVEVSGEDFAG